MFNQRGTTKQNWCKVEEEVILPWTMNLPLLWPKLAKPKSLMDLWFMNMEIFTLPLPSPPKRRKFCIFSSIIWCLAWHLEYMIVCADHNMWSFCIFSCIIWCLAWHLEYMIVCADHNMWWSQINMTTLVCVYVPRSYHYHLGLTRVFLGVQICDILNLATIPPKKKERPNLVNWINT